jgi:hypothetical protein
MACLRGRGRARAKPTCGHPPRETRKKAKKSATAERAARLDFEFAPRGKAVGLSRSRVHFAFRFS